MRKVSLLIVSLCVALTSLALVPPRDPSRWAEWQAQVSAQANAERLSSADGLRYAPAAAQAVGQRVIIPRVLLITVSFSDFAFTTPLADVDSMFNGQNWTKDGATGSLRQYFYDQSMGEYDPVFDIVGPVTLSHGYAYYGTGSGEKDSQTNISKMVCEACSLVDDSVDFSLYDSNNDGYVDLVYIYYAGFGSNDRPNEYTSSLIPVWDNLVWPAYWSVSSSSSPRYFDGKYISACEYSNELDALFTTAERTVVAGIGTACHEFGHALGLPDLYATNYATHKLLGSWDVMCYGLYNNDTHTPPSYSAYERFFMGWLTPTLITEPANLQLEHIATSNQAYMIVAGDEHNMNGLQPNPNVFYLLENRQQEGWDIDVPGSGLLLTRINYQSSKWLMNSVNNDPNSLGVDIIEADGLTPNINTAAGFLGKPGDVFPAGATEYMGIADHPIEQITMDNGVIRFVYRGGVDTTSMDSIPTALPLTNQSVQACKTIQDGQVLIHTPYGTYNLLGLKQEQQNY